jgi:methylation protein EvaC
MESRGRLPFWQACETAAWCMSAVKTGVCRICGATIAPFMTFGRMPIANGFLTEADIPSEYFYELTPAMCVTCATFQLVEAPPPARLFHDRYPFFSSTSRAMTEHFEAFAASVTARVGGTGRDPLIVEIGSNDGTMLRHFTSMGLRAVGVEPSRNVAAAARAQGLDTVDAFFGRDTAERLRARCGPAAAIVAANAICHIPAFDDLARGICDLLAPDGWFIFEDPYLGDMVRQRTYDQIYDEHVFMWSATSVSRAIARHGLELIDVEPQTTHGGSMRYICARAGRSPVSRTVAALLDREDRLGLAKPATFDLFRTACEEARDEFRALLTALAENGKRVAGYAATSKSTTILNYCGIDRSLIEYIVDSTPVKQGLLTPGSHIPVCPPDRFVVDPPDYAVLFAWNHAAEILAKERAFTDAGGKWISFVPALAILD